MKLKLQDTYFKQNEETRGYKEVIITGREVLEVLEEMNRINTLRVSIVLNKCRKVKKDADS